MQKEMEMPTNLKACGVSVDEVNKLKEEIANLALQDACTATNPKVPTTLEVVEIINKIKD